MSSDQFLTLDNISKSYGEVSALNNVSIDVKQGELVSFIGPSGCGKTTLLRTIGGFHSQDSGTVSLDGKVLDGLPPDQRPTGMVFQSYALFPHMSVRKNVAYGLKSVGVPRKEHRQRVEDALSEVRLEGYGSRKPSELSGGQQQRVAIARCLVLRPKVLLLDEPLSNLDASLRMIMRDEIRRIKEELDITVLFVTHDQEEALSISDRILVLKDGVSQQVASPNVIYDYPANEFVSDFVGQSNMMRARLGTQRQPDGQTRLTLNSGNVEYPIDALHGYNNGSVTTITEPDGLDHLVLVRPERIRIDEKSPVAGVLTHIVYNGNFTRYFLQVGDQQIKVDESNSSRGQKFGIGDVMNIRLPNVPYLIEQHSSTHNKKHENGKVADR